MTRYILNMATTDQEGQAQHFVMCENCQGPVEFTCIRCDLHFCGDCSLTHMRTKSKRGHELREYSSHVTQHCDVHPRSICDFYCKSCTAPICTECVSTNAHKLHDLSSMFATVTFFQTLISEECKELQTKVKGNFKKRIEDLESNITKVAQQCAITRRGVAQWGAKTHREIDILVESLHQEIKTAEERAFKILIEQKDLMESKIKDLEDALKQNKDILESENSKQIVKFQSKIDQLSELPSLRTIYLPEFVPSTAEIESNVKRLFGDVKLTAYHASKNFANSTKSRTSNEIYSDVIQQHGDVFSAQEGGDVLRKQFSSIGVQEPTSFGVHKDRDVSKKQSPSFGTLGYLDMSRTQLSSYGVYKRDMSKKQSPSFGTQGDRDMLRKQVSFFGAHKDRNVSKKQSPSFGTQGDRDMSRTQLSSFGAKENCYVSRKQPFSFGAQEDRYVLKKQRSFFSVQESSSFSAQEDLDISRQQHSSFSAPKEKNRSRKRFLECKVHIHPKLLLCLPKVMHFREKVENFLQDLNVRPLWSKSKCNGEESFLILESTKVTLDLDDTWKTHVRHSLKEFLNEWEVNSFNISEHLWDRMLEMLKTVEIPNPENIMYHTDKKERQIYVIGKAADAMKLSKAIQKALWDMKDIHG